MQRAGVALPTWAPYQPVNTKRVTTPFFISIGVQSLAAHLDHTCTRCGTFSAKVLTHQNWRWCVCVGACVRVFLEVQYCRGPSSIDLMLHTPFQLQRCHLRCYANLPPPLLHHLLLLLPLLRTANSSCCWVAPPGNCHSLTEAGTRRSLLSLDQPARNFTFPIART